MAVARESLSPLIRNVQQQGRRLSLELCQKTGNHHLSPKSTNNSYTPTTTPRNHANVSMNWSPIKNLYSIFGSADCCAGSSPNNTNHSPSSAFQRRRGSVDQNVFKSLTPSPVSLYAGGRRGSLTPVSPYNSNSNNFGGGNPLSVLPSISFPTNIIPSIRVQDASPPKGDEKRKKIGAERQALDEKNGCNENRLFCNVTPLRETFDNSQQYNKTASAGVGQTIVGQQQQQQRRKSSSSRYDFDEDFMRFVSLRCNLELEPEEILGRGSFGTVIQGRYHGNPVAVKIIKTKIASHLESMKGEQNAYGLSHPHIAQVLDIFQMGPDRALVVMELLQKGNLGRVLNDSRITILSSSKIRISGQIASALQYCHQKGILHLDVKPQNILLDMNDNCKLSDFGTSKRVSELSFFYNINKLEGTVAYKAPELFRGTIPSEKCDVYSFGVCMWQILSREEPYQGLSDHSVIYQVVARGLRPSMVTNPQLDYRNCLDTTCDTLPHFVGIYESCWQAEPSLRPDMKHLVESLLILLYKV